MEKKVQHISEPEYTYWMTNEGVPVDYNKLCIEETDVHPVTCKYNNLKKDIIYIDDANMEEDHD